MAQISSPFVGIAKGKLGEGVYYRAGGKTLARARNRNPRNPKSTAQCMQRLTFSSATRTAKLLREVIDHSFEGVEYGQVSVNHFVKLAADAIKLGMANPIMVGVTPYVPAVPLGDSTEELGTITSYPISTGSIPSLDVYLPQLHNEDPMSGERALAIRGIAGAPSATIKFSELASLGFAVGTQYTFIFLSGKSFTKAGRDFYTAQKVLLARVNFKQDAEADTAVFISNGEGGFQLNPAVVDIETSTNYSQLVFHVLNPAEGGNPASGWKVTASTGQTFAGTIIASRYENGTWRRSSQVMVNMAGEYRENPDEPGLGRSTAWNSLTDLLNDIVGEGAYPNDWYLNQSPNA